MGELMRTRILVVAAVVLSLVVAPAATAQAAKKTRTMTGSVHLAVIGENGENGSAFAGELVGKPVRRAAVILRNEITGSTSNGKAVIYAKHGTIRANVVNELQPQPDGSVNLPGTFKITGGTGRYRGATGSGTFQALLPANSTIYEATISGKIRY
jgi:hypothetical protein